MKLGGDSSWISDINGTSVSLKSTASEDGQEPTRRMGLDSCGFSFNVVALISSKKELWNLAVSLELVLEIERPWRELDTL